MIKKEAVNLLQIAIGQHVTYLSPKGQGDLNVM